jgi:hypothetical protein
LIEIKEGLRARPYSTALVPDGSLTVKPSGTVVSLHAGASHHQPAGKERVTAVYRTGALDPDRVAQAYPVVREIAGDLTLEHWSEFVLSMVADEGKIDWPRGIIVADLDGYIRGMFTYHVMPDLLHGRALVVRNFAVLQMVARKSLADSLLEAVHKLAQAHRCNAIHAYVPPASRWATAYFEERGHQVEKLILCRPLEPPD